MAPPLLSTLRRSLAVSFTCVALCACHIDSRSLSSDGATSGAVQGDGDTTPSGDACLPASLLSSHTGVRSLSVRGQTMAWVVSDSVPEGAVNNGLWLADLTGKNAHRLSTAPRHPDTVRLEDTQVLWADVDGVWSIPRAGGAVSHLSFGQAGSLVASKERLYWTDGAAIRTLARGVVETQGDVLPLSGYHLALDDTHLYVADETTVRRLTLGTDEVETVLTGRTRIRAMTLVGDTLYLVDRTDTATGTLVKVSAAGGAATELDDDVLLAFEVGLVVSDEHVYVTGALGLWQVPTAGGEKRRLACKGGDVAVQAGDSLVWAGMMDGIWSVKP